MRAWPEKAVATMKAIIDKKVYNTETATEICCKYGNPSDMHDYPITLYRSP